MKYKIIMAIALCVAALYLAGCSESDFLIDEQLEKGYMKLDSQEYEEAAEAFERVLEMKTNEGEALERVLEMKISEFEARYGLSDAYIGMEKYHRAERELLRLYEEDKDKVRASIALSELYIKMEKYDKADRVLGQQLKQDQDKGELWDALIAVREAEGVDAAELQDLYDLAFLATGLPYYQKDIDAEQQKAAQEAALEATTAEETTAEETTADEVAAEETTQFETTAAVEPADQVVQFIDPVFEQFVRDAYSLPEGEIMLSDISKIRKLSFSESEGCWGYGANWIELTGQIKTLEDLKWFENLGEISIGDPDSDAYVLGSLSSIGQLPKLWRLDLYFANITGDLSDLSQLNNLEELYISNSGITGDLSSIGHLTKMTVLEISHESITGDLSSISQCTEMRYLEIEDTEISGALLNLSEMVNLRRLTLNGESIVGRLSSLDKMESLDSLDLSLTSVSGDLSTLSGKPLKHLVVGGNMTGTFTLADGRVVTAEN